MGHRNMKLYVNVIGRSQHEGQQVCRDRNRHISILFCPSARKLPYLLGMTWSIRNSYVQVWAGGGEQGSDSQRDEFE